MVNAKLEAQRQTIKHYWLNGASSAKAIHQMANIPLRTVENNLKKLRETGTVEHKRGNGRKSKVTRTISRVIGQNVRRSNTLSTRQLAVKIESTQNISISHVAIWNYMKKKGYQSSLPLSTPMLTERHIEMRNTWAQTHMNDNWDQTIFTDETAFDLFRNKVRRWHKNGERPIQKAAQIPTEGNGVGRHFSNGKNPIVLFYRHYGWTLLRKDIASPTSTRCTKNVWGELAFATR
jgi:transposase